MDQRAVGRHDSGCGEPTATCWRAGCTGFAHPCTAGGQSRRTPEISHVAPQKGSSFRGPQLQRWSCRQDGR